MHVAETPDRIVRAAIIQLELPPGDVTGNREVFRNTLLAVDDVNLVLAPELLISVYDLGLVARRGVAWRRAGRSVGWSEGGNRAGGDCGSWFHGRRGIIEGSIGSRLRHGDPCAAARHGHSVPKEPPLSDRGGSLRSRKRALVIDTPARRFDPRSASSTPSFLSRRSWIWQARRSS